MQFVILIRRNDQQPSAEPARASPGADWKLIHSAPGVAVWIRAQDGDPLAGRALGDGYLLGATAKSARLYADAVHDWGAYVALRADAASGAVSVLRDCSGRIPAYWARGPSFDVISSRLEPLADHVENWEIDWDYLAHLLFDESQPGMRTGFARVREILPGEEITFQAGNATQRLVWTPATFYGDPIADERQARRIFREAAEAAVEFWGSRYRSVALDLSGGLDSSIMLGLLRQARPSPEVVCINAVVGHAESDERGFARDAATLHDAKLVELSLDQEVADYERSRVSHLLARPSTRLLQIGLGQSALAVARASGASAYVTGRGGDHLFFDHVPPSSATDYLRQTHDPLGWLRRAYCVSRSSGAPLREVLSHAFHNDTSAGRLLRYAKGGDALATPAAAEQSDASAFTPPWLLEAATAAHPAKFDQVRRLIELQRHYDRVGRATEIEEIHPFISQPMFEAAMRTPSYLFAPSTIPRQLQRETFADLLPTSVMNRRSKGATTSHFVRTMEANLPYLRRILLDGELSARGLLDRPRLEARLTLPALRSSNALMDLLRCVIVQLWLEEARAFTEAANLRRGRFAHQLASASTTSAGPPSASW